MHVEDAQSVKQVAAEASSGHLRREIPVRGGEHADVRGQRRRSADALKLSLLQHAQELDLHAGRQLSDLVEEERPMRRQFESSRLLTARAGERAALVAEQLGLEERVG